jgi:hypothetical protein
MACQYTQVKCTSVIGDGDKMQTARSAVARLCQMVRSDTKYKELPPVSCLGMLDLPFGHCLSNCPADESTLHPKPYKKAAQDYDQVLFSLTFSQSIPCL